MNEWADEPYRSTATQGAFAPPSAAPGAAPGPHHPWSNGTPADPAALQPAWPSTTPSYPTVPTAHPGQPGAIGVPPYLPQGQPAAYGYGQQPWGYGQGAQPGYGYPYHYQDGPPPPRPPAGPWSTPAAPGAPGALAPPTQRAHPALLVVGGFLAVMSLLLALAVSLDRGEPPAQAAGFAAGSLMPACVVGGIIALLSRPRRLSNTALAVGSGIQLIWFLNLLAMSG